MYPEAERPLCGRAGGFDFHGEEVFACREIARQIESMIRLLVAGGARGSNSRGVIVRRLVVDPLKGLRANQ